VIDMSRVRVESFAVSVDGYGAGPLQSREHPLGVGGTALHEWAFPTRTFQKQVFGNHQGGETGADDDFAARGFDNVGAWILGRNMFGPVRGPWAAEEEWNGWWGDDPPYHTHVFVLTHHPRPSVVMDGGTVFHFETDGIEAALERARECAGEHRDVRIGGGVATIRQYLQAGLVDEMHLAIAPVLLGTGECLLRDLDLVALGYRCVEHVGTPRASHVVVRKAG
jgi:dihydrofolate reductase